MERIVWYRRIGVIRRGVIQLTIDMDRMDYAGRFTYIESDYWGLCVESAGYNDYDQATWAESLPFTGECSF